MTKSTFKDIFHFWECYTESQFTVKLRNMRKLFLHLVMKRRNMLNIPNGIKGVGEKSPVLVGGRYEKCW